MLGIPIEADTINETPLEASEGKAEGDIKNEGGNSINREYDTSFTLLLMIYFCLNVRIIVSYYDISIKVRGFRWRESSCYQRND